MKAYCTERAFVTSKGYTNYRISRTRTLFKLSLINIEQAFAGGFDHVYVRFPVKSDYFYGKDI